MNDLSYEALLTIKRSHVPAVEPFSGGEPDDVIFFHNLIGTKSDQVHNELEAGGYIEVVEYSGESWWCLSKKGVKLSIILRSIDEL